MSLSKYLQDSKEELGHVSWPTRKQTIIFTFFVILISIIVALFLGFSDLVFNNVVDYVISR